MQSYKRFGLFRRITMAQGATLLEVMFSMGIIAVGLLGVLTLLPVAGNRAVQGTVADSSDRVGRNAIRQFDAMQMRQPDMWAQYNSAGNKYVAYPSSIGQISNSFCIDPLFVSTHAYNQQNGISVFPTNGDVFPHFASGPNQPRMERITLANMLEVFARNPQEFDGMSLAQAYEVFLSQDDLEVIVDKGDRTLAPAQKYLVDDPTSTMPTNLKRDSKALYSWMATLSPLEGRMQTPYDTNTYEDMYVLSVVVFHRRDLSMTTFLGPPPSGQEREPDNERLAYVSAFLGLGIAGGDVTLQTLPRPTSDPHGEAGTHVWEDLEVKSGDWLMLSATTANAGNVFKWYQVLSADGIDNLGTAASPGPFTRILTIQGSDWTRPEWFQLDANKNRTAFPSANYPTQATLVSNVVAVYEKTIRLERSSLWTVQ